MSSLLTDDKKAFLFKQLATKSSYEAGLEFDLDKHYKNAATMASTVVRIYHQVKNNPEKYLISQDTVDLVTKAVESRSALVRKGEARVTLREKLDEAKSKTIDELVLDNRAKAWQLLSLKLDDALSTKKKREKISLGEVAKVAGISFDKGQLTEGKSTDHVSLMAKVDTESLSPAQAMEMVLKMREFNSAIQEKKNK